MTKKIVAIGGGENGRIKADGTSAPYETGPMDQEIINLTEKERPNFLFIAHSQLQSLDAQESYFQTMKNIYNGKYNCECRILKSDKLTDKKYVQDLIDWSDIIYEGGGNTLDMIELWKNSEFDKILKNAWEKGKVLCGVSAGANCWFEECSSDSLRIKYGPEQPLIAMNCLGFQKGFLVPHADEPGRKESVKDLLRGKETIGLLLSNCAALEIVDNKYRIIINDATCRNIIPFALKVYWQDGEYIEESIDLSSRFKNIDDLYLKSNEKSKKDNK